jgi:LEA14-like dessication related protein
MMSKTLHLKHSRAMPFVTEPFFKPQVNDMKTCNVVAIPCKLEVIVKITVLPTHVRTVKNGWKQFILNGEGQRIRVKVRPKAWDKLHQASLQWQTWTALIKGDMGHTLKDGFEMLNPTVQIFQTFDGSEEFV